MTPATAIPLDKIVPHDVEWLWKPYLPAGKLVLLDGDPGVGKSLIAMHLAAKLSGGFDMPCGTPTPEPRATFLIAPEDDASDTTLPRAAAAGADLGRIFCLAGPGGLPLQFPADLKLLAAMMKQHQPALVVIDPIIACLPQSVIAASDQSVRRVLSELGRLAERHRAAVLMIRHLKKAGAQKALYRGAGSIGFIASVRTGLLAARHPTDPSLGVLSVTKSNLAAPTPSMAYRIEDIGTGGPVVRWVGPVDVEADVLVQRPTGELKPRDRASLWLQGELAAGPRRAKELQELAAALGIPDRTLRRAKSDLRLCTKQMPTADGGKEWWWYDPNAPWPKHAPFKKPYELPPLPDLD